MCVCVGGGGFRLGVRVDVKKKMAGGGGSEVGVDVIEELKFLKCWFGLGGGGQGGCE